MTSNYSSDPRVPPAKVGHLGKHTPAANHGPVGLPRVEKRHGESADPGPTYDDFLEHDGREDEVPDKTG
jgi:hypothetical protein